MLVLGRQKHVDCVFVLRVTDAVPFLPHLSLGFLQLAKVVQSSPCGGSSSIILGIILFCGPSGLHFQRTDVACLVA